MRRASARDRRAQSGARNDDRDGVGAASRSSGSSAKTKPMCSRIFDFGRGRGRSRTASTTTSCDGDEQAIRRDTGTRAAAHVHLEFAPHEPLGGVSALASRIGCRTPCRSISTRCSRAGMRRPTRSMRRLQHDIDDADARLVQRQALAGMLWSKQYYQFDVTRWMDGDPGQPTPPRAASAAATPTGGICAMRDIVSMPDKWEYPWYASWDLAFHAAAFALIDPDFAKKQLLLLVKDRYQHPNGQLPAYEWAFGDANPPVHAWATWRVYEIDRAMTGKGDRDFLEAGVPQAAAEFLVVGEPQGRRRPQHFPGRLSRARQRRHLRPVVAAADRRPHRPGRWHRVDGRLRARPDAHRARTGDGEPRVRRYRA